MGQNTKMMINGDLTQIDLPRSITSGLADAIHTLRGVKGISFIEMDQHDIVRHKLVSRIVEAYDKASALRKQKEAQSQQEQNNAKPEEKTN
jgi:phosphate starvation-inducible PhoH-like protein